MPDLHQLNINNLTSLWKKMGLETNSRLAQKGVKISLTWPHRYWLDWDVNCEQEQVFHSCLASLPSHAIIPVWFAGENRATALENLLLHNGYRITFSQLAMVLDLRTVATTALSVLNVIEVRSKEDIEMWAATASAAFDYPIDVTSLHALAEAPEVNMLLLKKQGQPVATALIYQTGAVVGAHLVGVTDNFRGQGIARALMQYVIQYSIDLGAQHLTLQASVAGEPLYRQLGFVEQFLINNYQREQ